MISCSQCGKEGHNKRTCPQVVPAAPNRPPKQPPRAAAKSATAGAATEQFGSVVAQLEARLVKLRKEVLTIERVVSDLRELEV